MSRNRVLGANICGKGHAYASEQSLQMTTRPDTESIFLYHASRRHGSGLALTGTNLTIAFIGLAAVFLRRLSVLYDLVARTLELGHNGIEIASPRQLPLLQQRPPRRLRWQRGWFLSPPRFRYKPN